MMKLFLDNVNRIFSKDMLYDRLSPRQRLMESLDEIFAEKIDPKYNLDAVECKLFGIGAESPDVTEIPTSGETMTDAKFFRP